MKKTLKLTLLAFGALSLFACDGGPTTTKSTTDGKTGTVVNSYGINVVVSNLIVSGTEKLTISNSNNNDSVNFTTSGSKPLSLKVDEDSGGYNLVVMTKPTAQTCLITSGSSNNITADVNVDVVCTTDQVAINGNSVNGKMYYMSECAVCHRAGGDDLTYTFAGSDVAENYKLSNQVGGSNLGPDMHAIGPKQNLMGRFDDIPVQRVADLEVYFAGVPAP